MSADNPPNHSTILLVDNGSIQPEATLGLRRVARRLSERIGRTVEPVSLLHSSKLSPEDLGGRPAEILEPFLRARASAGEMDFTVLPLFFGPSRALTEYIPQRLAALQKTFPNLRVNLAQPLAGTDVHAPDNRLVTALVAAVDAVVSKHALHSPPVVLVDHGSPIEPLAQLRNALAAHMETALGPKVVGVRPSSMERREGPEYAFNDPLLEHVLASPELREQTVVLAMLFLNPGRHAGPGGDIDQIVAEVQTQHSKLRVVRTGLLAEADALLPILADRLTEAETGAAWLHPLESSG
ncbi:MAG: sirohydrochlorin chelatase [Opitutales bacterium]